MALPTLTPEQRKAALAKAAESRKARAAVKAQLKSGSVTLAELIAKGQTDEVVGKIKILELLQSIPGLGKVRATALLGKLGIAESRRVRGLGEKQIAALTAEFARR